MVPPPDNTGDEFPDFENMSFEEQMAWLESLARRQGAGDDQLTTAADLDVPLPIDAEIDEPGYVPFEGSRSAREMKQQQSGAGSPAAHESEERIYTDRQPIVDDEHSDMPDDSASEDPMQWLDSLAAQPESDDLAAGFPAMDSGEGQATFEELDDLLDLEPDEAFAQFDDDDDLDEAAQDNDAGDIQTPAYETVEMPSGSGDDDPLGGVDPMLWLESLAARQGANLSELTTTADLDIADVPPDAVIDEPGYIPFEGSRSAREAAQATQVEGMPEVGERFDQPLDFGEEADELSAQLAQDDIHIDYEDTGDTDVHAEDLSEAFGELTDEDESMTWLESLAKRQGARDEELLTEADRDVPELPGDTLVDEPGYVEYAPLSILPPETAPGDLSDRDEELAGLVVFEDDAADEGLSWLADLASEPDQDVADFLAFEDDTPDEYADAGDDRGYVREAPVAAMQHDDLLAGMSDEDIAIAQAQGTLTPEQELAWLKRQARALAETREAEQVMEGNLDVPPAEPGDIPDWLEDVRKTAEQEMQLAADAVLDDSEIEEVELPDWLQEADESFDVSEQEGDEFVEVALDGDVESLWGDDAAEHVEPELDQLIPDSELAAFINGDFVPDEPDALAEALDEEYERLQSGDDAEPEWYTAAVAKIAEEAAGMADVDAESPHEIIDERMLAEPEPIDAPGWLTDEVDDENEAVADLMDADMPDWLRETSEDAARMDSRVEPPGWLAEDDAAEAVADSGDVLAWLRGFDDALAADEKEAQIAFPAPDQVAGAVEDVGEPVYTDEDDIAVVVTDLEPEVGYAVADAALPTGEQFAEYRERLAADPADYQSRLSLARALRTTDDLDTSLDHYELLLEAPQVLPDVSDDLAELEPEILEKPRVQRLLGDAFLRRGMLAEALKAYRNALHRL